MEIILDQFANYLNTLDWVYIFSFILITYLIRYYRIPSFIGRGLGIKLRYRYQVLIIGGIYGMILFFARDYDLKGVELLLQSFLMAIVVHKFFIEILIDKIFPGKQSNAPKKDIYEI